MSDQARTVIKVKNLDITFKMATGDVHAIRGVDYELKENEVLALVGESGCGKSISVKCRPGNACGYLLSGNAAFRRIPECAAASLQAASGGRYHDPAHGGLSSGGGRCEEGK